MTFTHAFTFGVLALPLLVSAYPYSALNRTINATEFATIGLYEQFAAASYCSGNLEGAPSKLACKAGNCPLVQAANTTTVVKFLE
jgi:hypothetical protein